MRDCREAASQRARGREAVDRRGCAGVLSGHNVGGLCLVRKRPGRRAVPGRGLRLVGKRPGRRAAPGRGLRGRGTLIGRRAAPGRWAGWHAGVGLHLVGDRRGRLPGLFAARACGGPCMAARVFQPSLGRAPHGRLLAILSIAAPAKPETVWLLPEVTGVLMGGVEQSGTGTGGGVLYPLPYHPAGSIPSTSGCFSCGAGGRLRGLVRTCADGVNCRRAASGKSAPVPRGRAVLVSRLSVELIRVNDSRSAGQHAKRAGWLVGPPGHRLREAWSFKLTGGYADLRYDRHIR